MTMAALTGAAIAVAVRLSRAAGSGGTSRVSRRRAAGGRQDRRCMLATRPLRLDGAYLRSPSLSIKLR